MRNWADDWESSALSINLEKSMENASCQLHEFISIKHLNVRSVKYNIYFYYVSRYALTWINIIHIHIRMRKYMHIQVYIYVPTSISWVDFTIEGFCSFLFYFHVYICRWVRLLLSYLAISFAVLSLWSMAEVAPAATAEHTSNRYACSVSIHHELLCIINIVLAEVHAQ